MNGKDALDKITDIVLSYRPDKESKREGRKPAQSEVQDDSGDYAKKESDDDARLSEPSHH